MRDDVWSKVAAWFRRRFPTRLREAPRDDGVSRTAARARFWAEFREGRDEAETRASRRS